MTQSKVLNEVLKYNGRDVRRNNHLLKVYGYAKLIGTLEEISQESQYVLEIAAILHDIGIRNSEIKYGSCAGPYQEKEGAVESRALLEKMGFPTEIIERVVFIVGHHHSYLAIDGMDFQILVEADFIVNIDEDGMKTDAILAVKSKYFKTASGKQLLETLYGV